MENKKYRMAGMVFVLPSLLILCLGQTPVAAQQNKFRFDRISVEHGLSHSMVYTIVQDHKGFLWFGTQRGLNKFDGYSFTVYENNPLDKNTLSDNDISQLYEDKQGMLWLATWGGGLNKFDPYSEKFTYYLHDPNDPNSLSDNHIQTIFEDHSGQLWIGSSEGGLTKFDRQNNRFIHYVNDPKNPESISHNRVWAITETQEGGSYVLWVGTTDGLNRFDPNTGKFISYHNESGNSNSLSHSNIRTLYVDRKGIIWAGTQSGLNAFDPKTGTSKRYLNDPSNPFSLSHNIINCIYEDITGNVWVGTNGGGLNLLDRTTQKFRRFINDPANQSSLSYDDIRAIVEDRSGNLWIATRGGGISKLNRRSEKFTHFFHDANNRNSISNNSIRSVYEDQTGLLWIGTDGGGVNVWDRQREAMTLYPSGSLNGLSNEYVYAICEDNAHHLWFGTRNGLTEYDPLLRRFRHYFHDPSNPNSLSFNNIQALIEDHNGLLWIGTFGGGLDCWNRKDNTFTHYDRGAAAPYSISDDRVYALYEDKSGTIWVGTFAGGLGRIEPEKSPAITFYKNDPENPYSIGHNSVRCIYEDRNGHLWIGTEGGGLNCYDRQSGKFYRYTEKDGLSNDVVYGILEDSQGRLWLSTNNGLSQFTPPSNPYSHYQERSNLFRNYYENDGLQNNVFNQGAYCRGKNGQLYFGGINGLNQFNPKDIQINNYVPPIVLTAFLKFDKQQRFNRAIAEVDDIQLSYRDNFFAFEFAALDFSYPDKNHYQYKLEGFDGDWIYAGTRRYASYTNLDGGDYLLRIKGSNNDLIWNEEGVAVKIHIDPPFWATWWFRILAAVIVIGGVLAGFQMRIRAVIAHRNELEREVIVRTKELKQQKDQLETALKDLRETQSHLIQSEKMASLGQLTGGIAHEINNPLAFVDGNLNYFEDYLKRLTGIIDSYEQVIHHAEKEDAKVNLDEFRKIRDHYDYHFIEEDMMKLIRSCKNGTERIKRIIKDLRNFANIDDNELRHVSIHDGINTTLSLLNSQYSDRIEIIKEFGDVPEILCYPGALNQVFMNLLLNAIQSINKRGQIRIATRRLPAQVGTAFDQGGVEIRLKDTGSGIPDLIRGKIFDPFFTTKDVGQGSGLGLTISYGIIEKHEGTIDFTSEDGHGTEFIVCLPIESPSLKHRSTR